jgi:hypothetical protein
MARSEHAPACDGREPLGEDICGIAQRGQLSTVLERDPARELAIVSSGRGGGVLSSAFHPACGGATCSSPAQSRATASNTTQSRRTLHPPCRRTPAKCRAARATPVKNHDHQLSGPCAVRLSMPTISSPERTKTRRSLNFRVVRGVAPGASQWL